MPRKKGGRNPKDGNGSSASSAVSSALSPTKDSAVASDDSSASDTVLHISSATTLSPQSDVLSSSPELPSTTVPSPCPSFTNSDVPIAESFSVSSPRLWEDMHIEDFQALSPVVMKNRFSADVVAQIHLLGDEAKRLGTFKHHGSDGHFKYYLQTGSFIHKTNPGLVKVLREAMEEADRKHYQLLTHEKHVNVRLVEYHTYYEGGGLIGEGWERRHFDGGSFLTMVVMLSQPGVDFEGGKLVASRTDWNSDVLEEFVEAELLNPGDCVVFPSHKFHNVTTVTKGKRHVCVMELWSDYEGFEDARPGSWGSAADISQQV